MRVALLVLFLASFPALADEKPVPPMPAEMRAKFDRVMANLWNPSCSCWQFIFEGKLRNLKPPLDEKDRWAIMGTVERGELIPVDPRKGSGL